MLNLFLKRDCSFCNLFLKALKLLQGLLHTVIRLTFRRICLLRFHIRHRFGFFLEKGNIKKAKRIMRHPGRAVADFVMMDNVGATLGFCSCPLSFLFLLIGGIRRIAAAGLLHGPLHRVPGIFPVGIFETIIKFFLEPVHIFHDAG